jgi:hypothetical protein
MPVDRAQILQEGIYLFHSFVLQGVGGGTRLCFSVHTFRFLKKKTKNCNKWKWEQVVNHNWRRSPIRPLPAKALRGGPHYQWHDGPTTFHDPQIHGQDGQRVRGFSHWFTSSSFISVLVNWAELCVSSGWEVTSGTFAIEPAEILYLQFCVFWTLDTINFLFNFRPGLHAQKLEFFHSLCHINF